MTDLDTAQIATWLIPAGIDLTPDRLEQLTAVVGELRKGIEGRELAAVRAAHGELSDSTRGWAAGLLGQGSPTSLSDNAEHLLERLIACAVVAAFDDSDPGSTCALAALSADFMGLSPLVPESTQLARDALDEAGWSLRRRGNYEEGSVLRALGNLPPVRKPTRAEDETITESVDVDDLAEDVGAHASALSAMARKADQEIRALVDRQVALDEEVEMLWWSLRAVDARGKPFASHEATRRAALTASELAERTSLIPGPPSATYLLVNVLGPDAASSVSLGDLAAAADEVVAALSVPQDRLLPVMSAAVDHRRGATPGDDESWRRVASTGLGVDFSAKTTLAAGAQQIYRELLLERLLSARK